MDNFFVVLFFPARQDSEYKFTVAFILKEVGELA